MDPCKSMVLTLFMSRHGPASSTRCYLCCCQPVHVSVLSFGCLDGLGHSALRVRLLSVFHDHRWLMLVPYILALAIFVSRHEVVRYLTDSSNPVTALSSHHYSVKVSMYEKAELIKSYRIVPFHLLSSISFGVPLYSFVRHHLFSSPSGSLSPSCSSASVSLSVS